MSLTTTLVLCFAITLLGQAAEVPFLTQEVEIPGMIYKFQLNAGDQLIASAAWAAGADLDFDVYLYAGGQDLFSDNIVAWAASWDQNPEILTYTIEQNGTYYVRVDLYTETIAPYTFLATVNGMPVLQDSRIGLHYNYRAVLVQFETINTCKAKVYLDTDAYTFAVFSPGATPSSTPNYTFPDQTSSFEFDVNQSGKWTIAIIHNITSTNETMKNIVQIKTFEDNLCLSIPLPFSTFSTSAPALIYPVPLSAGQKLKASCFWTQSDSDFDLYLYSATQDLLTNEPGQTVSRNGYLEAAISYTQNPEILTYTAATAGVYYLRVELYTQTVAEFKLLIEVNGQVSNLVYDVALPPQLPGTIKQIKVTNGCRARIQYSGPAYPIRVYAPGTTASASSTPTYIFSNVTDFNFKLTSSGTWSIVVIHGITSGVSPGSISSIQMNVTTFAESLCTSTQVTLADFSSTHPSLIYPLTLNSGDKVKATCSWTTPSVDFDLYFYQTGQDLLTREPGDTVSRNGYLQGAISTTNNPEVLQYTVAAAGTYYLRVELYTDSVAQYKLILQVNGVVMKTDFDSALSPERPVSLKQFTTSNLCQVKAYYTGPNVTALVFAPNADVSSEPTYVFYDQSQFEFVASSSGVWSVALFHNITSTTAPIPFTLNIKTKSSSMCVNRCSGLLNPVRMAPGTKSTCILNCDAKVNSLKTVDAAAVDQCACKSKFNYHQQKAQCLADCSLVPNSNGTKSPGVCNCNANHNFNPYEADCLVNCTSLPNSAGTVDNDVNSCKCKDQFIFVNTNQTCRIKCDKIDNALTKYVSDSQCACNSGYVWSDTDLKCNSVCGDGIKTSNEQCDDGNLNDKDGCSSQCKGEVTGLIIGGSILAGVTVVALAVVGILFAKSGAAAAGAAGAAGGNAQGGISTGNILKPDDPPFQSIE